MSYITIVVLIQRRPLGRVAQSLLALTTHSSPPERVWRAALTRTARGKQAGRGDVRSACAGAAPPPPGQEIFSPSTAAAAASTPAACSVVAVRTCASSDARCGPSWCAPRADIRHTDSDNRTDSDKQETNSNKRRGALRDPQRGALGHLWGRLGRLRETTFDHGLIIIIIIIIIILIIIYLNGDINIFYWCTDIQAAGPGGARSRAANAGEYLNELRNHGAFLAGDPPPPAAGLWT